ncbi:hypothetical protein F5X97DRAFT_194817 [Nemania serpens]|nr:hypothetical protein F5X97DRAFT_194817 [Nemania serpens]
MRCLCGRSPIVTISRPVVFMQPCLTAYYLLRGCRAQSLRATSARPSVREYKADFYCYTATREPLRSCLPTVRGGTPMLIRCLPFGLEDIHYGHNCPIYLLFLS